MSRQTPLLQLAGVAALAGAALRVATAFPDIKVPVLHGEALYFTIDLLLTLGLMGLFAAMPPFRTWVGVAGFAGSIAGFELIRTGDRLGGGDAYQRSAAVLSIALAVAGIALVRGPGFARYVGVAWLASLAVGLAGTALHWPQGFFFASLLFCAGFGLGGLSLLVSPGGRSGSGR